MTRAHRISNLIGAIVPFLAFIAAMISSASDGSTGRRTFPASAGIAA